MIWSLLTDHGRQQDGPRELSADRLHASILMAGDFSETVRA
jgi:hypothetical protein